MSSASVASPPAALIADRVLAIITAARSVSGFLIFLRHAVKLSQASGSAWWDSICDGVSNIMPPYFRFPLGLTPEDQSGLPVSFSFVSTRC
jgi:hypothetical protein